MEAYFRRLSEGCGVSAVGQHLSAAGATRDRRFSGEEGDW
jgi:hypothetical protein